MGRCPREPELAQMLADPLTQALMRSDGVDESSLRDLVEEARLRIADAEEDGPATSRRGTSDADR